MPHLTSYRPPVAVVRALARTMAARDAATQKHAQRVQQYSIALAEKIGISDERALLAIEGAALLHDIGKLGVSDRLLDKPGPLTPDEYDQVKQHAAIGGDILAGLDLPGSLALIVRHHHEHWDGTGYPDGLRGEDIPVGARIVSIADCYDALTSDRPYRRALSHGVAVSMMNERRGTMFDPEMATTFLQIVERLKSGRIRERFAVSGFRRRPTIRLEASAV